MSGTWALEDVPHPGGTGPSRISMTGAYVGEGMPPMPVELVNKIRRWEFVEKGELLPEFWAGPKEAEGEPGKEKRHRQGGRSQRFSRGCNASGHTSLSCPCTSLL